MRIKYCSVCAKSNRKSKHPFYSGLTCSRKCYLNYKRELYANIKSIEFRLQELENDRLSKQRQLNRYEECDENRCKHCGRCSHFIHKGWMECFVREGEKCEL